MIEAQLAAAQLLFSAEEILARRGKTPTPGGTWLFEETENGKPQTASSDLENTDQDDALKTSGSVLQRQHRSTADSPSA